jgi:hypothetical protein
MDFENLPRRSLPPIDIFEILFAQRKKVIILTASAE